MDESKRPTRKLRKLRESHRGVTQITTPTVLGYFAALAFAFAVAFQTELPALRMASVAAIFGLLAALCFASSQALSDVSEHRIIEILALIVGNVGGLLTIACGACLMWTILFVLVWMIAALSL